MELTINTEVDIPQTTDDSPNSLIFSPRTPLSDQCLSPLEDKFCLDGFTEKQQENLDGSSSMTNLIDGKPTDLKMTNLKKTFYDIIDVFALTLAPTSPFHKFLWSWKHLAPESKKASILSKLLMQPDRIKEFTAEERQLARSRINVHGVLRFEYGSSDADRRVLIKSLQKYYVCACFPKKASIALDQLLNFELENKVVFGRYQIFRTHYNKLQKLFAQLYLPDYQNIDNWWTLYCKNKCKPYILCLSCQKKLDGLYTGKS
jgi:hypothetical protein